MDRDQTELGQTQRHREAEPCSLEEDLSLGEGWENGLVAPVTAGVVCPKCFAFVSDLLQHIRPLSANR